LKKVQHLLVTMMKVIGIMHCLLLSGTTRTETCIKDASSQCRAGTMAHDDQKFDLESAVEVGED